jgi:hypothetical protein
VSSYQNVSTILSSWNWGLNYAASLHVTTRPPSTNTVPGSALLVRGFLVPEDMSKISFLTPFDQPNLASTHA